METAGKFGTETAGRFETETVGRFGTETVGRVGTETVGRFGTETVGRFGTEKAKRTSTVSSYDKLPGREDEPTTGTSLLLPGHALQQKYYFSLQPHGFPPLNPLHTYIATRKPYPM